MRLETCYAVRSTCLTDSIDGHADANFSLDGLHVLIEADQHSRVDTERQIVQEVMVLACNKRLHIGASVQNSEESSKRNIRKE